MKKWKRRAKLLATSILVVIYFTIGLFNGATLRREESKEGKPEGEDTAEATEKDSPAIKTIVGYSMEFRMKEEMTMDEIKCEGRYPMRIPEDGEARWRYDRRFRLYALSAFYDVRLEPYHYVRVIGLLPRNTTLYCQIWFQKNETLTFVIRRAVVHEIWSANWGKLDSSCDNIYPSVISCPVPLQQGYPIEIPVRVSFVDKHCNGSNISLEIRPPKKGTPGASAPAGKAFVVCVKPLNYTNHVNNVSLVEWIELNARFGATKIVVFVNNLDRTDLNILEHYRKNSIVEVHRFEPPISRCGRWRNYEQFLWQKRKMEIIAYNDCFYRNIYEAKFVIPLDIDEIIVPKMGNNWYSAFVAHFGDEPGEMKWPRAVDKYASFSVKNVYFFANYPKEAIIHNLKLPKGGRKLVSAMKRQQFLGPQDSIFKRVVRSSNFSPESDSIKSFVHVPTTLSVFNHYAFHVLGEASRQYILPETAMQLNHYRDYCDPLLIDGCHNFLNHLTVDDGLEKFRNQILHVKHSFKI